MITILSNGYENLAILSILGNKASMDFHEIISTTLKNNHLEGYHSKLSSIQSSKSNNVLAFINMIKKSASQVHSQFHANELFVTLQEQLSEQILTFEQYFDKISAHIMDTYGTSLMKFDQDEEQLNYEKIGRKRKRKIAFDNPLIHLDFLKTNDFVNLTIKLDQPNNEQASELFSKELFTILKSQIHIYKTFVLNNQPVRQDLFDAFISFSSERLVKP
ncbi:hypothetical protein BpHYR1_008071 [Brachionus plicatilis]|uniref:Uncharacterized protein n=1 Tax=Brachionus plicatilis TaxID=10195 RepID=A0A3M7PZG3_BRAPC|nr:hypothetical protein BpHYR1_008071 [Brachionus plicatilis]